VFHYTLIFIFRCVWYNSEYQVHVMECVHYVGWATCSHATVKIHLYDFKKKKGSSQLKSSIQYHIIITNSQSNNSQHNHIYFYQQFQNHKYIPISSTSIYHYNFSNQYLTNSFTYIFMHISTLSYYHIFIHNTNLMHSLISIH